MILLSKLWQCLVPTCSILKGLSLKVHTCDASIPCSLANASLSLMLFTLPLDGDPADPLLSSWLWGARLLGTVMSKSLLFSNPHSSSELLLALLALCFFFHWFKPFHTVNMMVWFQTVPSSWRTVNRKILGEVLIGDKTVRLSGLLIWPLMLASTTFLVS